MKWRIPGFLLLVFFFFLSSKGERSGIDTRGIIEHKVQVDAPNFQKGGLLPDATISVPVHQGLKGRIGRCSTVLPFADRSFGNAFGQIFSQQSAPLIGSEYCASTFYSLTEALSCFLQGLLFPKHSFW